MLPNEGQDLGKSTFWIAGYFRERPSISAKNRQSVTTSRHHKNLWISYPMATRWASIDGRPSFFFGLSSEGFEDAVRLRRA